MVVRDSLEQLPGYKEAHCVTGPYDIIAMFEADSYEDIVLKVVVNQIQKIPGVARTMTCLKVPDGSAD